MNSDSEEALATLLLWALWIIPGNLLGGWVIMLLWGWFIAPLGVASIGLWHAIGLNVLVGFLKTPQVYNDDKSPLESMAALIMTRIFMAPLVLGVGWVVLQLMGG